MDSEQSYLDLLKRTNRQLSIVKLAIEFSKTECHGLNEASNDWRDSLNRDVRDHIIKKQVEAIRSAINNAEDENFIDMLLLHTKGCEETVFSTASSKIQYFYLMANRIQDLENGLKAICEKRRIDQQNKLNGIGCKHSVQKKLNTLNISFHENIYNFLIHSAQSREIGGSIVANFG